VLSLTVEEFLDELARATPVPGAGPAAALVTAAAAALAAMAARSSRESWPDAGAAAAQADALRARAVKLGREDADALEAYLAARGPTGETRREARDFRLGQALDEAADIPLAIAETACDVAMLAAEVAGRCVGDVRPDAASAALLALGAARASAHLVEVNLAAGPEDPRVKRAHELLRAADAAADVALD
jgi:formiminotetrahydrofolate cyclodeaminase